MTGSAAHVAGPWRYERLDGVGHWMQLEAPEVVNALLLDFLGQHRNRGSSPSASAKVRRSDGKPVDAERCVRG
jgi:hypothetical protein